MGSVKKPAKQRVIRKVSNIFEKENYKNNKKTIFFLKKFSNFLFILLPIVFIVFLFGSMIFSENITGGDLRFIYNSMYDNYSLFPYAWLPNEGIGLGAFAGSLAWVYLVTSLPVIFFGSFLKQDWNIVVLFGYIIPFFLISFFSIKLLFSRLFGRNNLYILSFLLYSINTYILMVLGGGQVLIALGYAFFPLTLLVSIISTERILELLRKPGFFNGTKKTVLRFIFITGTVFSFQLLLDPRIAYIALSTVFIYLFLHLLFIKEIFFNKVILFLAVLITPLVIATFINMFWVLPTVLLKQNPLEDFGKAYTTLDAVKYFSFAKLENSISLLHPHWPENIFGKTYFMKPEFLFLPILAFFSLFFLKKESLEKRRYIFFFSLLGLLGAFIAKGANEPFGQVYLWMFNHVPGFILFRDPTKWYMLIAISYSILIPYSLWKIYEWLKTHKRSSSFNLQYLFLILVFSYLIFLIRPALSGGLSGIFASHKIPVEYKKLEQFISKDEKFYRTLWFPKTQRFAFYSEKHSMVSADNLFDTYELSSLLEKFHEPETERLLQNFSIRYIVVPYDNEGEIFLKDRKYDEKTYLDTIRDLSSIKWIKKIDGFEKIAVFEIPDPKDHFWTTSQSLALNYKNVSPVEYGLEIKNAKRGNQIIFSESYDAKWIARDKDTKFYDWANLISSNPYQRTSNSFSLRKEGNYSLTIYYYPQMFVNFGVVISFFALILVLTFILFGSKLKKW